MYLFRKQSLIPASLMLACSICPGTMLHAQTTNGSLTGEVTDPSGAIVANAQIEINNTGTGATENTRTNSGGTYTVPNLAPGTYKITTAATGFETNVQSGLQISVGQAATLNVTLPVGSASETVQVSAAGTVIDQSTAQISTLVNERSIKELPLNGRDPSSLVLLAPGATNVLNSNGVLQATNSFPTETGASVNGGRQGSTYYLLDGVQNVDTYLLLAAPFPNADATQEFRVVTNNFDARYGFAPGAVVTIQTKSGANDFHGGIFEFLRNGALNAGNYFGHGVDPLKRNQFGGFLGGPIKRDRVFFFGNYQQTEGRTTALTNTTFTPTAAMLQGDFTAVPFALKAPFVNNRISPALFNPASARLAQLLPLGQNPTDGQVIYPGAAQRYSYKEATGRIDWDITKNQHLVVRNFLNFLDQPETTLPGNILNNTLGQSGRLYNELISHTWTISPTSVNVASVGWLQNDFFSGAHVTDRNNQPVCLSQYINVVDPPGTCYPEGGLQVSNGFAQPYTAPNLEDRRTWTIADDYSQVVGQHTLILGGEGLHQYANEVAAYPANATVNFYGSYTGFGLADFLLGEAGGFVQGGGETQNQTGWVVGIYAQDAWKLKPNLTLTYGARWEPNLPPTVENGRGAAFIPGEQSTRYPNAPLGLVFPGDRGVNSSLLPNDYTAVGPRIGLAFQPKSLPNTAFRGAFGIFFAPLEYSIYNHTADISPFSPTYHFFADSTHGPIDFSNPFSYPTSGSATGTSPFPPFASAGQNPPASTPIPGPVTVGSIFSRNFKNARTQSWNFSVEQQFGRDFALHLAYVGSESYDLVVPIDQNPGIYAQGGQRANANFQQILQNTSNGIARYHSLQAGIEKRLSYNLQFQSNFTWSKNEDDFSGNSISFGADLPNPFDLRYNFGKSDLNIPYISVTNFVYTTPSLKGHNTLLRETLGAWEVTGIYTLQSGTPFTVFGGNGGNNSGAQQYGDRADYAPGFGPGHDFGVHQGSKQQWLNQYFNTAAFVPNQPNTFGNTARNIFQGPGLNNGDLGFFKNWQAHERYNLQFRWEMFNAFNHPTFANPNTDPTAGTAYGRITAIGPVGPRVQQAALKLTF